MTVNQLLVRELAMETGRNIDTDGPELVHAYEEALTNLSELLE